MLNFNDQLKGQLTGLMGTVEKMKTLTDKTLSQLPTEDREKIAPLQGQMSEAIRAMKTGDTEKLSAMLKEIEKLK